MNLCWKDFLCIREGTGMILANPLLKVNDGALKSPGVAFWFRMGRQDRGLGGIVGTRSDQVVVSCSDMMLRWEWERERIR